MLNLNLEQTSVYASLLENKSKQSNSKTASFPLNDKIIYNRFDTPYNLVGLLHHVPEPLNYVNSMRRAA